MPANNEVLQQGRYRIIQQFGQDGTGVVYEAYDNLLETNVVLRENLVKLKKVTTAAQRESLQSAFASEAKMLTALKHESFLHVRDYFSEIDGQYLVMEAVSGSNFADLLERNKTPFALAEVAVWADQLLDALAYLHSHAPPIIHRDIKPLNVTLNADGKVKLLPFGVAKSLEAGRATTNIANPSTLHYLPLEQIWGELDSASQKVILNSYDEKSERILEQPPDARSDIYALGATVYHLLTARPPVDALTRSIDLLEGKTDPLPAPAQINPSIPPEVSDILMRALEIKRENRFDSAVILRQALRTAFVRVRERQAKAAKSQAAAAAAAAETQPAEQISPAPNERRLGGQEQLRAETEQKRQAELIKQRERETEAEKIKIAEQRAAESETKLAAKAEQESVEKKSAPEPLKPPVEFSEPAPIAAAAAAVNANKSAPAQSTSEFNILFAEPQKESKSFGRMAIVALTLIVFAGGGIGGWFFLNSNTVKSNQTIADPTMTLSEQAKPEPTSETPPAPTITENSPETIALPTPAVETVSPETPIVSTEVKNKPVAPKVKKQTPTAPKAPAAEKKNVTVDDIINDN